MMRKQKFENFLNYSFGNRKQVLLLPSRLTNGAFSRNKFEKIFSELVARIKKSITFALPFKEKEIWQAKNGEKVSRNIFSKKLVGIKN